MPNRRIGALRVGLAVALLGGATALPAPVARAQADPDSMDDEQFVRWIESSDAEGDDAVALDPRRVAKLLFGVAATLEGNRTNVRLLQNALVLREPDGASVRDSIAASFGRYAQSADRFRASVSGLLDRPGSVALLHRALVDGGRTCWHLDTYTRQAETYGARPADLLSVLASTQACQRFRRAAFHPRVQQPIADALEAGERDRGEIEALREEVGELERLVEDLRKIDSR